MEEFSIATYALPNSAGKSDSINARCLLISSILSKISIFTGQISSQALQEVQAQSSSEVILSKTLSEFTRKGPGVETVAGTAGWPDSDITCPTFNIISLGSKDLPVWFAGHTDVHLPQTVHASRSINCFQVKWSIISVPTLSISSASKRLPINFIAPLGLSFGDINIFIGDVNMCLSLDNGIAIRNTKKETTWSTHDILWKSSGFERFKNWPTA